MQTLNKIVWRILNGRNMRELRVTTQYLIGLFSECYGRLMNVGMTLKSLHFNFWIFYKNSQGEFPCQPPSYKTQYILLVILGVETSNTRIEFISSSLEPEQFFIPRTCPVFEL